MADTLTTIWDDIIGQVRLNHPKLVRGWFETLRLGPFENGVACIHAASDAQVRYLEKHCHQAFGDAAQAATGRLISVAFDAPTPSGGSAPADQREQRQMLNSDYTFDHFVTGPCNRLANAASLAVAEEPGRAYNPFFIHGPVGVGKTHLLQSMCHAMRAARSDVTILYISCETFINHFIEAVEEGALHQFRYRYRHVDALVIDDIQFLAERERSQEEFFHTFNTLHHLQRQIILSADCSPREIPSLEERLVSRFSSGLVALMDRPCLETRMAIVRKKAKLRCIEVPEDVVHLVAARVETNIRELEGALIKIDALSQMRIGGVTLELAQEAIGEASPHEVRIPDILELVAGRSNVKVSDLQGKRRSKAITRPRHVCMYLARQLTPQSLEEIGGFFGGRDHSTVLHASRAIGKLAEQDPELRGLLDEIASELKNGAR